MLALQDDGLVDFRQSLSQVVEVSLIEIEFIRQVCSRPGLGVLRLIFDERILKLSPSPCIHYVGQKYASTGFEQAEHLLNDLLEIDRAGEELRGAGHDNQIEVTVNQHVD